MYGIVPTYLLCSEQRSEAALLAVGLYIVQLVISNISLKMQNFCFAKLQLCNQFHFFIPNMGTVKNKEQGPEQCRKQ